MSAIVRVQSIKLPKDINTVDMKIENYEIQEVDNQSNQIKWNLKANFASADPQEKSARVDNPDFIYYKEGKVFFTVSSKEAFISQGNKAIEFYGNVDFKTANKIYQIKSGFLKFKDNDDLIYLGKSFSLLKDKFTKIESMSAEIQKNMQKIHVDGGVTLEDTTALEPLYMMADTMNINNDGTFTAKGNIEVVSKDTKCYSDYLNVIASADKKPQTAILKGNPYIVNNGQKIYADKISYDFKSQTANIEGNVHSE